MHPARPIRVLTLLAIWLLLAQEVARPQAAKDTIPQAKLVGESQRTASRLVSAQRKIEQGQWAEAIEELQAVLDEAGDDLVPLDVEQAGHWVAARRQCHARFAALPPAALKQYRARVDAPAKKLLEKAESTRDVALLKRIVEDYFASRPTERALDRLGDLAFERGDFHEAERWWGHLAKPVGAKPQAPQLSYPDPQLDPALVRAKLILALLFRGDRQLAADEAKLFRTSYPKSEGELAGSKGNYAEILQKLIEQKDLSPPPGDDTAWPTFAGDASRSHTLPRMLRVRWLEEPWRARLDGKPIDAKAEEPAPVNYRNASEAARALAYYPVIVGNRVVVADARFVSVHDLNTGRRQFRYDLLANAGPRIEPEVPVKHDERYSLTVAEGRIFVRLGLPVFGFPKEGEAAQPSHLVCLDMPVGDQGELTRRWQVTPRAEGKELACYEGSPVVQSGRVWIAQTRFNRNVAATAIECYDAATGTRRWRQEVCEATELTPGGEPRYRPHLLTLAGPNVVYCSHSGAIVAVDAVTGKRSWSLRYPRRGPKPTDGQPSPRDLAPAVYAAGRVYVAPGDFDRILCLDVLTGRTLWESKPTEVVHLLGVARGKLIFTTGNQPRGIRALDAVTGDDLRGWLQPDDGQGELPSLGRAVFAGDWLLWPTVREGLRILNLEDGRVADKHFLPPGTVRSGNLAVANGCVVVATDRELLGYVAPARLLEPRRKAAAAAPTSADAIYRFALAEADAGLHREAGQHLAEAWRLAAGAPLRRNEIARRIVALYQEWPAVVSTDGLASMLREANPTRTPPSRSAPAFKARSSGQLKLTLPPQEIWKSAETDERERLCTSQIDPGVSADYAIFERDNRTLVCREAGSGKLRWERRLSAPVFWLGAEFDQLIVGSPDEIRCLAARDGAERWAVLRAVSLDRSESGFGDFQLTGERLFCIVNQALLLCINLGTGKTLWQQAAPGAAVRPLEPGGKFNSLYHAGKDRLLIQTSLGRIWLLDSATGRQVAEIGSKHGVWQQPPVPLDPQRIVIASGSRSLTMLDFISGNALWTHEADRKFSLSGEPPQTLGDGENLVCCISRNYGYELDRLDIRTGARLWPQPVLLRERPDLCCATLDESSVYVTAGGVLQAVALANGLRLWEQPLSGSVGTWRALLTKNYLLAHPADAEMSVNAVFLARRYLPLDGTALFPTLAPWSVARIIPECMWAFSRAQSPSQLPLVLLDPKTGKVLHRLSFAGQGPAAGVALFDKQAIVAIGDRAWGLH
jgi:outer membrane protein assembly factor BamB